MSLKISFFFCLLVSSWPRFDIWMCGMNWRCFDNKNSEGKDSGTRRIEAPDWHSNNRRDCARTWLLPVHNNSTAESNSRERDSSWCEGSLWDENRRKRRQHANTYGPWFVQAIGEVSSSIFLLKYFLHIWFEFSRLISWCACLRNKLLWVWDCLFSVVCGLSNWGLWLSSLFRKENEYTNNVHKNKMLPLILLPIHLLING